MKYTPSLPDESVNRPRGSLIVTALKLTVALALIVAVAYAAMLLAVDYTVAHLSAQSEKRLMSFAQVDFNMSAARHSDYLQRVTDKLAACADLPYTIRTYVVDEPEANAFALPGGKIMITRGMLGQIRNENELASVIGHELGHFKHKDHLKGLGKSLLAGLISMAVAEKYGALFGATLSVADARYSQSQELSADLYGLDLMQCAYGNVHDATALFSRMDSGEKWRYFLASHPDFGKRVARMRAYIGERGYDDTGRSVPLPKGSGWFRH